jgi:hypothetical protein
MSVVAAMAARPKQAQMLFDWLLPAGDFLTLKQISHACGWSVDSVERAFDEGRLLGNCTTMSAGPGEEKRRSFRVPRALAVLFLAEIANHDADAVAEAILRAFKHLPPATRQACLQRLLAV